MAINVYIYIYYLILMALEIKWREFIHDPKRRPKMMQVIQSS